MVARRKSERTNMMSTTHSARAAAVDAWLRRGAELPKFNAKLVDSIARISWEDSNVHEIERLISGEPAMIAYTLRAANSPFFGLSKRVDSIRHALTVLGVASVRSILMRSYMVDTFGIKNGDKVAGDLVAHSILCGIAARELAVGEDVPMDSAFLAGVMLNVGKLMMLTCERDKADMVYDDGDFLANRANVEVAIFSFDHVDLTLATLSTWLMPDSIVDPVRDYYRRPTTETALLRVLIRARMLADFAAYADMHQSAEAAKARAQLVAMLGEAKVDTLLHRIREEANALGSDADAADGGR
jgi:HD-like signal output (HDOD) protein